MQQQNRKIIDTDEFKKGRNIGILNSMKQLFGEVVLKYRDMGFGDLTIDEANQLIEDPATFVYSKLPANAKPAYSVDPIKQMDLIEKPKGYSDLLEAIEILKIKMEVPTEFKLLPKSGKELSDFFSINAGIQVEVIPSKLVEIEESHTTFAKGDAEVMLDFVEAVKKMIEEKGIPKIVKKQGRQTLQTFISRMFYYEDNGASYRINTDIINSFNF